MSANVLKAAEDKTFPGAIVAAAGVTVGPGDLGRRPAEHVLRLLPGGLRARPVRDLDRPDGRRRQRHGARRDALPLQQPAAGRRLDAAQQPLERQGGAGLVRHPAGRDVVPAADGERAPPHRSLALREPHQARRELRGEPRPRLRRRALGGAERLLAVDDRGRDRRAHRRGRTRRRQSRSGLGGRVARRRRRLPALDQALDGDDQRPARAALLHPPLQDRRSERRDLATTSATAGRRSTSAR